MDTYDRLIAHMRSLWGNNKMTYVSDLTAYIDQFGEMKKSLEYLHAALYNVCMCACVCVCVCEFVCVCMCVRACACM